MRFTILQVIEVTAIVASALALDRIPPIGGSGLLPVLFILVVWGAIVGAYLGIRWSNPRSVRNVTLNTGVAAAIFSFLEALRAGISIAVDLRRATNEAYFSWSNDWPMLTGLVCCVTLVATILAMFLALTFLGIGRICTHIRIALTVQNG